MSGELGRLVIIGASGHGMVVADIACLVGYDDIRFLDDDSAKKSCCGYPVVGPVSDAAFIESNLFVAIGNAAVRRELMERYRHATFPSLVHPSAVVARTSRLGAGTVVMAGAIINPGAIVGRGCIVNTCASVDHGCMVADFAHVAVGAHLCGEVTVGAGVWIGAGSTVSNNVDICAGTTVGAGAVVVRDITEAGTYVGVPVRRVPDDR